MYQNQAIKILFNIIMSCKTKKKPSLFNRVKSLVMKSNNQMNTSNKPKTTKRRRRKNIVKKIATHSIGTLNKKKDK